MQTQHSWLGRRILIVEDDYLIASQLASNFLAEGILVAGPSANVKSAMAEIAQTPIAGAVLDINLGEELVFPVADELEKRAIPFVFSTGFERNIIPERHARKVVLQKPIAERSILSALSQERQASLINDTDICRNSILSRLPKEARRSMQPKLQMITVRQGMTIEAPNQVVSQIYFPIDCVVSVIAASNGGSRIETGLIGREGLTGAGMLVGDDKTIYELVAQIEGDAIVLSVQDFLFFLNHVPELRLLAARHARALGVQVSHTALANGRFELSQRLARWLAMVYDRVPGKAFDLTHDYLSIMLGVRRSSVTNTLHVLEGEHLIRSTRGSIEVRDYRGLVAAAGEAYGLPESEYDRLMALPLTDSMKFVS
ncbi:CRP-like cAMP-binding protein [Neorhizobium huautlense]|uniref:CRP-like cAMP-binding protein n=1 Tax=Neorhizobium huautlense TaxID=67774 RepID=A0ABT9Q334_9HYPH|nr:helix-turn-helix domain-containing protein [Neorhizobium huautlense]MDP9840499.1 CRP-like cAMP-binding protein [Neorhizobium huautlense]